MWLARLDLVVTTTAGWLFRFKSRNWLARRSRRVAPRRSPASCPSRTGTPYLESLTFADRIIDHVKQCRAQAQPKGESCAKEKV